MGTSRLTRFFAALATVVTTGLATASAGAQQSASLAAQDRVRLAEIVPALEGTELGALDLGAAPPPGGAREVARAEVIAALRRAGRGSQGLAIPASTTIRRRVRTLAPNDVVALAREHAASALAPCELEELSTDATLRVGSGRLEVTVDGAVPARSGSAAAVLVVREGDRELRAPLRARVRCPAPVVQPGVRLRVMARVGAVTATTNATARQPGRVGDVIQVTSEDSRATLRVRVVDAESAEVVQ